MDISRSNRSSLTTGYPVSTGQAVADDELEQQLGQGLATLSSRLDELQRTNSLLAAADPAGLVSRDVALDFLMRAFAENDLLGYTVDSYDDVDAASGIVTNLLDDPDPEEDVEDTGVAEDVDERASDLEWLADYPDVDDPYLSPQRQLDDPDVDDRNRALERERSTQAPVAPVPVGPPRYV